MSKFKRLVFGLLLVILVNSVFAQNLTISSNGQTGTSGTNWSTSGSNPVTITFTGTANINKSVIEGILATDNLAIEAGTGGQGISITAAISNTTTKTLTIGAVSNTNAVTISAAISNAAEIILNGGLITVNSNLTISNASNISLFAKSGLRFGNAGITLQTQGGDLILSSDYDANSAGNIISEGALTLTSNGGAIKLGGGPNAAGFAYGTAVTSINEVPGIWIKGAVNFNSGNGDISIKGFAAAGTPSTNSILPSWGIGLGFSGTNFQTSLTSASVSLNSGTGKIYVEGWGRNPNGPSGGSPSGILFNNWEGVTTQPLTITSANTTADAIKLIGNTENTANGQRYKNSIYFWSNASNIRATAAGGGITISGKTFAGNDHYQIFWSGGNILATSGPIVISTENNGFYLDGDLYIGSRNGVTGNTTSSSSIRFSVDNYAVTPGKLARVATTGDVTIEAFGSSFKNHLSVVQPFSTATGWSFNENGQTMSALTIGKSGNASALTVGTATTVAGPVSAYGGDIALNGTINTSAGNATADVLLKSSGTIVATADIITNGGDITLWSDADANGAGGIRIDDNVDLDSRTQSDRTANTNTTGGGKITLAGGLDDGGTASGVSTLVTGLSSGDGYPDGYAVNSGSAAAQSGIVLGTSATASGHNSNIKFNSGGGDIRLQGLATTRPTNGGPTGLLFFHGYTLDAGDNGNVVLLGNAAVTTGTEAYGMDLAAWREASYSANGTVLTKNGNITVVGRASGGTSTNMGMAIDGTGVKRNIFAATGTGTVSLRSLATGTGALDMRLTNVDVLAASGDISLISEGASGMTIGGYNIGDGLFIGHKVGSAINTSTSNVLIQSNQLITTNKPIAFATSGTVTLEPFGTSFGSAQTFTNVTFSNSISSLTIGKSSNTSGITIGSATTIAGPVSLFGGAIAINAAVTATNNTLRLNASGAVTQTGAIVANNLALTGTGTFTLNNANNNIATIAAGDNTTRVGNISLTDASGGLTIGTVGNTTGINSTGTVLVETLVGDLTLSGNISTTNTTANAIVINAGKSTAIGTVTGGNILVTGTPTLTTGTGGITKLFSGSDAGSTGLTTLVGGAANTRNGIDETSTSYSPSLVANGKYALYRTALQTVAPVITSFSPTTAGNGETVVITGTGFTGVTVVKFGNVNAISFVVNSDTQISAVVGAAASGDVLVQNSTGSDTEPGFIFKVVELKFEGNTLDQTAADRDGTVVGTATYSPGASGQAICFTSNANATSVSNYLSLPNDLIRGRGTNFTISLRFKTATFGAILGYQNRGVADPAGGTYVPILYVQENGKLSANLWQGAAGRLSVISTNRVDDNNWHKVEFSVAPGSITVYIDGVFAGSSTGTIDHLTMEFNQIGAVNTAGTWGQVPVSGWIGFTGCIDEFIIVDRSLTASQIQQVTQLPTPTITSFTPATAKSGETVTITGTNFGSASSVKLGGVEARRFTIVSATEIRAIVPFNATVNSTVEVTTAAGTISGTTFIYDCNSNALDFDGTDDHLIIGDVIENLGAFSQEAWVYWKGSSQPYSEIFSKETVSALSITNTNKLHANFGNGTSWGAGVNSTTSIPLNTWTHVAVTRSSSGAVKLYINGVLDASSATLSLSGQNTNARVIGGKLAGNSLLGSFSGSIDELKAWNTERTAQQIIAGMGTELIGNESGLIAYYNFNQGTAAGTNTTITTLNNLTAAINLDGTLTNMARSGTTSNFVSGVWPVIITQPAATLGLCTNATSGNVITVSAVGQQLTYQWYSNSTNSNSGGTAISGANTASFTVPTSSNGTVYYYVVVSGCSSTPITSNVSAITVSAPAVAGTLSGSQSICVGLTTSFSSTETGGTWSSSNAAIATVNASSGLVTGVGSGTATMTYTVIGCSSVSATRTVIVTAPPAVPVLSGSQNVCINGTTQFIATGESGALTFNGTTNIVETANNISALNITGNITVETWVKVNQLPNDWVRLVGKGDASNRTYGFWLNTDGRLLWQIYGSGTDPALFSTVALQTGTWNHIAATRVGNVHTIYINGVARGTVTASITPLSSTMPLTLGFSGNWHTYLNGQMDEVRVWNVGRTATQINENKDVEIAAQLGLVAYYKFNQGTPGGNNAGLTTLIDDSGNGNNGTLRNFVLTGTGSNWSSRSGVPTTAGSWTSSNTSVATVSSTGVVTGVAAGTATITFTATGGGGCAEATATRTVTVAPIPVISYSSSSYSVERTSAFTAIQPTSTGATVASYAISPALPTGLSINTTTGIISGTPSVNSTSRTYTVTATSANGCVGTTTLTLEVFSAVAPSALSYAPASQTVRQGTAITTLTPSISGGTVASYSISPALPSGITFNASTGVISGTLTAQQTGTVAYTITATNSGGSTTATVTLVYNTAPTDVALSSTSVAENAASGTAVATLSATDADAGDTFTYTLVSGTGDTDNASFTISGNSLRTAAIFDFETKSSYSVRVRVTDAGGLSFEKAFTIGVTNVNEAPTNISASASSVAENAASGTSVATLSATDIDAGDTFTYTLVSGTGDTDNASFAITGSTLSTAAVFDFETKSSYSVRVRVTDAGGLTFEKVFTIGVTDVNDAPTNITASASSVAENAASGTAVGTLSATDADAGETFTYTLVSGTGDTDNASFAISGNSLRTTAVFDFETKSSYSVRVRVTDAGGLTFEKVFIISVTDVNEAPTALALSNASVLENAASGTTVGTLAGTDADAGDTHTYTLVTGTGSTDNASFTITGTTLSTAAVFNFEAKNSYSVRVRVTDAGGLSFERVFTISVTDVNEAPTLTAITDRRVYNVSTSQVVNLAGITAGPETAQSTTTTVSTDRPATFSSISVVGTQIQFTLAPGIVTPQDVVVTVRVRDNGGVANGGVDSVVRTFRLGIDPMPVAAATPNLITLGATSQLSAAGANAVNYTWVAVGGSGIVGSGATINVRPAGTTTYAVVVTNSFGYQATIPVLLTVIVDYKLVPNNLVTPNGDGVNDRWVIPNIDMYPDNEVMVYDKAGRAVFAKRGYNNEWDGTVNGKKLKEDAYFYVIKFNKDGALPIRGYLSIVR